MVSSLSNVSLIKPSSATLIPPYKFKTQFNPFQEKFFPHVSCCKTPKQQPKFRKNVEESLPLLRIMLQKSVIPVAASIAVLLCSNPAHAGFLSGLSGIESVPGPELPQIDFLTRFNEENQKKYAENDARFKETPLLKKLLEQTKLNKEKNKQAIQDKYCLRGAEWGVGDCSTEGMTPEDKDKFIAMLKQKAGVE
ncbi:hypothetical protein ACJIZ3_019991 [Penstemon smallii]|uniref:Uncharacterized protein n=1 Tax=Penstemon smallii TaxID=265156 RepID=A0ABD3SHM2_9LAMI